MRRHSDERLATRASAAAVERGSALLVRPAALAAFVHAFARARGVDVDRVACALGAGTDAAHLVVAKDGGGVTCLAPGMTPTVPIVPWPEVEAYLLDQAALLSAQRALHAVKDQDDTVSPLVRVVSQPHRLVRREWDVVRALLPLSGIGVYVDVIAGALAVLQPAAAAARAKDQSLVKDHWRAYVAGAVAVTVVGDRPAAFAALLACVASGDVLLSSHAAVFFAAQPAATLAFVAAYLKDHAPDVLARLALARVAAAVAVRNAGYHKEARRLQARVVAGSGLAVDDDHVDVDVLARLLAPTLFAALRLGGDPSEPAFVDETLRLWRPTAERDQPPRLAPRAAAALTDVDAAATVLWREARLACPVSPLFVPGLLSLFALAPPEALLPGDEPEALYKLSLGARYLDVVLPQVQQPFWKPWTSSTPSPSAPAQAEKKVPPNAPCPCGSGKKWKKCHGRA